MALFGGRNVLHEDLGQYPRLGFGIICSSRIHMYASTCTETYMHVDAHAYMHAHRNAQHNTLFLELSLLPFHFGCIFACKEKTKPNQNKTPEYPGVHSVLRRRKLKLRIDHRELTERP